MPIGLWYLIFNEVDADFRFFYSLLKVNPIFLVLYDLEPLKIFKIKLKRFYYE